THHRRMAPPKLVGQYGASLPLFQPVGVRCIGRLCGERSAYCAAAAIARNCGLITGCSARRERPRRCATDERDEIATAAHSITSSAMASSDAGTAISSNRAVWALTSSNLVDCTTGRSAGLAPLRMRLV